MSTYLGYIIFQQVQLGQVGMGGVLAVGPQQAGPSLCLQQVQESPITAWPAIQTAEVSGTCTPSYHNVGMHDNAHHHSMMLPKSS